MAKLQPQRGSQADTPETNLGLGWCLFISQHLTHGGSSPTVAAPVFPLCLCPVPCGAVLSPGEQWVPSPVLGETCLVSVGLTGRRLHACAVSLSFQGQPATKISDRSAPTHSSCAKHHTWSWTCSSHASLSYSQQPNHTSLTGKNSELIRSWGNKIL